MEILINNFRIITSKDTPKNIMNSLEGGIEGRKKREKMRAKRESLIAQRRENTIKKLCESGFAKYIKEHGLPKTKEEVMDLKCKIEEKVRKDRA